jgi:hypothetical protein
MHRFSIAFKKSSGYDVTYASVPFGTALGAGLMAVYIGATWVDPKPSSGELIKRAYEAIGAIGAAFKKNGPVGTSLIRVEFTNPKNINTLTETAGAAAATSDSTVGAIVNATAALMAESRTGLIEAGLEQCWEVLRETINVGGCTGITK